MNKNKRIPKKPDTLTPKQEAAILALLEHPTIEDAAQSVGISRTSIWAWMKIKAFRDRVTEAQADLFHEGMGALKASMTKAADTLVRLLDSEDENTRRLAASSILGLGIKAVETIETESRLRALEEIASNHPGRPF